MKNLLKLTFIITLINISGGLFAQEEIKQETIKAAQSLESSRPNASQHADSAVQQATQQQTEKKQEPTKKDTSKDAKKASKEENKKNNSQTDSTGGTKMAIKEQGVPDKARDKKKSMATMSTDSSNTKATEEKADPK